MKPRQMVVLSGKGGTGKTSVVAALASIGPDKVLADCDVDVPDLHLLLAPSEISREPFFSGLQAHIDPDRCVGCGKCLFRCRFDAIQVVKGRGRGGSSRTDYVVDRTACEGCGLCSYVCASDAVEMLEPQRGEVFVSYTRHGPLVHGRLVVGGENSGKLVAFVKERALAVAEEAGVGFVLVDGPPGIGCPAIASVAGADLVLLVTEPTVSGLHDLKRVAELVAGFERRLAVCINKSDINPEIAGQIRGYCAAQGLPVLSELNYDRAVTWAQMEGKSIVEYGRSPTADRITGMWPALEKLLTGTEA